MSCSHQVLIAFRPSCVLWIPSLKKPSGVLCMPNSRKDLSSLHVTPRHVVYVLCAKRAIAGEEGAVLFVVVEGAPCAVRVGMEVLEP